MANMGRLKSRTAMLEFDIHRRPDEIVEVLLARQPKIVGFGVYIWNVRQTFEVIQLLKQVRPAVTVVLGGPEVSYEIDRQEVVACADYVIVGEADLKFAEVCDALMSGNPPLQKVIKAPLPKLSEVALPYRWYDGDDIANRIIYVEASRGCPYTCEFCLSSLDIPVRQFEVEPFLAEMDRLYQQGVQHFKFVDRTFNLNLKTSRRILEFFKERYRPGLYLHFEMVPDRLPEGLREVIVDFPSGCLQFEVGIQTFDEATSSNISRRQNLGKLESNLRFLRTQSGVHVHADLIVGLPGESIESFGAGFDRLIELNPQEIQVGILKRLRGTPIVRHDGPWEMVYSAEPPYEIVQNKLIDFATMQRMRRFARYWDLIGNSGNFVESTPLIWAGGRSPFRSFLELSDWLFAQSGARHGIALTRLLDYLFQFLVEVRKIEAAHVAQSLWRDYQRCGRSDKPARLRAFLPERGVDRKRSTGNRKLKRQMRHEGLSGENAKISPKSEGRISNLEAKP